MPKGNLLENKQTNKQLISWMARKPGQWQWCSLTSRKQHRVKGLRSRIPSPLSPGSTAVDMNELELDSFNDFAPIWGSREGRSDWLLKRSECLNLGSEQAGTSTNSLCRWRSIPTGESGHSQPKPNTIHLPMLPGRGSTLMLYHHESLSPASPSCHTPPKQSVEMKRGPGTIRLWWEMSEKC